jgi:hypothetical protein
VIPSAFTRKPAATRRPQHARERFPRRRLEVELLEARNLLATWTPLTNLIPNLSGSSAAMLLPNGNVLVQGGFDTQSPLWYLLKPGATTGYVGGAWTSTGNSNVGRLFYGSNVLNNDTVFMVGGEDSTQGGDTNTSEAYNVATGVWTNKATFVNANFGDDPTVVLNNGKVLGGYIFGPQTYLYDPAANSWAATGTKLRNDRSDEEGFALLPDGSVLTYECFTQTDLTSGHAQRYNPATGVWTDAGVVPVALSNGGAELGPYGVLPDGRVIVTGATNHTAIYTPSTNSWVAGPDLGAANRGADDAPGVVLPNGHFLFTTGNANPNDFQPPARMLDFDPNTNQVTDITATLPVALQNVLAVNPCFLGRMLMLPTGQVLFNPNNGRQFWVFTPDGGPADTDRPEVYTVTDNGGGNFHLTGTGLNGMSEGATYGDDAEMSSNYPIVSITTLDGVTTTYAMTSNWTPGTIQSDGTVLSCDFKLPSGTAAGVYLLTVSGAGIQSFPYVLFVGSNVPGGFDGADGPADPGSGDGGDGSGPAVSRGGTAAGLDSFAPVLGAAAGLTAGPAAPVAPNPGGGAPQGESDPGAGALATASPAGQSATGMDMSLLYSLSTANTQAVDDLFAFDPSGSLAWTQGL